MSTLRVSGLASGIDTESIVKDLMKAHRISVDKVKQERQWVEWQQEAYAEINRTLRTFRYSILDEFNKISTLSAKKAVVSGNGISAKALGSAQLGNFEISVTQKATAASMVIGGLGSTDDLDGKIAELAGESFSINGKQITIEEGDTFNKVLEKINKNTDVTAFYYYDKETGEGQLSLVSKKTGQSVIEASEFISALGEGVEIVNSAEGQNAIVTINGIQTEQSSNIFTVNGVEITIHEANSSSSIEVVTDTESIVESVKKFVEEYNKVNSALTELLNEKRYRDYAPLTDEQKEEMTEKQIELWEEKAKSGLLRNDPIISSAYNQLRSAVSAAVANVAEDFNTLAEIGITTGAYTERGKLHLNEDKLRKAIETDPDAVVNLFTAKGTEGGNGADIGIAERMEQILEKTLKEISRKAGTSAYADIPGFNPNSDLSKRLSQYDKEIDRMNDRLARLEDRYYRQFAAMEAAIQRYNTQSMYLMSQFGMA